MAIFTLRNRHQEKPFVGMFDGKIYEIPAGGSLSVLDVAALHLQRHSILTDNPVDPSVNMYQLAIVEKGQDVTPLTGELPIESLDRSDMPELGKVKYVRSNTRPAAPLERTGTTVRVGTSEKA